MSVYLYTVNLFGYDKVFTAPDFFGIECEKIYITDSFCNEDPLKKGWDRVILIDYNGKKKFTNGFKRKMSFNTMLGIDAFSKKGDVCIKIDANVTSIPEYVLHMYEESSKENKPISGTFGYYESIGRPKMDLISTEFAISYEAERWKPYRAGLDNLKKLFEKLNHKDPYSERVISAKYLIFRNSESFFRVREDLIKTRETCFQGNLIYSYFSIKHKDLFFKYYINKRPFKRGGRASHNKNY